MVTIVESNETNPQETQEDINRKIIARYATMFRQIESEFKKIENKIKGYTNEDIKKIISNPENYQLQLVDLSNYMYRHSGFFRRIIDYFVDMVLFHWTIDTEVFDENFYKVKSKQLNSSFISFAGAINRLGIEKEMHDIFIRVFLEDACFGYLIETNHDSFIYYLPSNWCSIRKSLNGVNIYGINPQVIPQMEAEKLPSEIQALLKQKTDMEDPYVYPPPEKCFCIKFNSHFTYLYPPLFDLLKNIIDIDDYKDLGKAQTESENYNLLGLEIPIDKNNINHMVLTDEIVAPVARMARSILPKAFGIIPSPLPFREIQWKSNATAERNRVKDAVNNFFDESGVSKDLLSSAGSGSQLIMSIENDATIIYKLYRQIEKVINLKMMLSGFVFPSYKHVFSLMNVNYYNKDDKADKELKLSNSSLPNKLKLCAISGINPSKMLGNEHMENIVLGNGNGLGSNWTVLKSTHTQSGSTGGRPTNESKGIPLSEAGEQTAETDSNNPDNRV